MCILFTSYWFYSCAREALLRRIGHRVKRLSTRGLAGTGLHTKTTKTANEKLYLGMVSQHQGHINILAVLSNSSYSVRIPRDRMSMTWSHHCASL